MLIGIDAHNLEGKRTGVGRYLLNLLKIWSEMDLRQFYHTTEYDRIVKNGDGGIKFILYFKDEIPADLRLVPTTSPSSTREGESKRGWFNSDLFECKLLKVGSTAKFMNWDLGRAAKKDKVDILFCPDYRAPIFYKGNIAVSVHDISYEVYPEWFNWKSPADRVLLKWASKQTAKKAKLIFAPVEFVKNEIIKYYGVPAERIVVAPLSVDPDLYNDGKFDSPVYGTAAADEVKKKYGIKDKFIFYVGSIFSRRHLSEVIAAFEMSAKENDHYQFLIGGKDYTGGQSVNKLVETTNAKLGREAILRVDFIVDDELKLLYSACAFFIWLSDYEGFGLPPLEAMSLGAPVITTDGSSLRGVVGEAALLIKDNSDVKEIYRAMHKLTRDNILREELIFRGKEQAAKFSWKECAEKTMEALKKIQ